MRSYRDPPRGVKFVADMLCHMFGKPPKYVLIAIVCLVLVHYLNIAIQFSLAAHVPTAVSVPFEIAGVECLFERA